MAMALTILQHLSPPEVTDTVRHLKSFRKHRRLCGGDDDERQWATAWQRGSLGR